MKRKNIGSALDSFFAEMGELNEVKQMTKDKLAKAEKPITHGGPDRRGKLCRCQGCGIEVVCTPVFDFYTRSRKSRGPLYCLSCLCDVTAEEDAKKDRASKKKVMN